MLNKNKHHEAEHKPRKHSTFFQDRQYQSPERRLCFSVQDGSSRELLETIDELVMRTVVEAHPAAGFGDQQFRGDSFVELVPTDSVLRNAARALTSETLRGGKNQKIKKKGKKERMLHELLPSSWDGMEADKQSLDLIDGCSVPNPPTGLELISVDQFAPQTSRLQLDIIGYIFMSAQDLGLREWLMWSHT